MMTFHGLLRLCAVLALQSHFFCPATSTPVAIRAPPKGECAAVDDILNLIHAPQISAAATKFCSSYISIPLVTSVHTSTHTVSPPLVTSTATVTEPDITVTVTTTEPDVTATATLTEPDMTVTTTLTVTPLPVDETSTIIDTATATTTSLDVAPFGKRNAPTLPPALKILEAFLGKQLSTACSCLSITPSTILSSTTSTTSLPTPSVTITTSTTPIATATDSTTPTVTATDTLTPTVTTGATTTLAPVTDIASTTTTTTATTTTTTTSTSAGVKPTGCNPGGAQPTFILIASGSGTAYDGEYVTDSAINGVERLFFTSDESSALSFTFNDDCFLVAISDDDFAYVTSTAELTEVFLFPPGTTGYTALTCSVTAANVLDCAMGMRDFATCPSDGDPVFFEDGPTSGCSSITFSLVYES